MSFRYTGIGALLNEDKFADAAKQLVELLVTIEVERAAEAKTPIEVQTNKAAAARKLNINYRTISRWVASLKDHGHDVILQAEAELKKRVKDQKAAA